MFISSLRLRSVTAVSPAVRVWSVPRRGRAEVVLTPVWAPVSQHLRKPATIMVRPTRSGTAVTGASLGTMARAHATSPSAPPRIPAIRAAFSAYSPPRKRCQLPVWSRAPSLHCRGEHEAVEEGDQDQVAEQDQRPAEVVPDHLTFLADELARRDADAGGLRRDRLADLGADRVQRRQEQWRHLEQ